MNENVKEFIRGGLIGYFKKKKQEKEKTQGKTKPAKQQKSQAEKKSAATTGKTSGFAIASLVLGIFAVLIGWIPFLGWPFIILALVFGIKALGKIKKENLQGRGMAIAGIVLGSVGLLIVILMGFAFIFSLNSGTTCKNAGCFVTGAKQCMTVNYQETTEFGTFKYTAKLDNELHKCVFTKEIVKLSANDDPFLKAALEGKQMQCAYAKGEFNGQWVTSQIEGLEDCNGELKEAVGMLLLIVE